MEWAAPVAIVEDLKVRIVDVHVTAIYILIPLDSFETKYFTARA